MKVQFKRNGQAVTSAEASTTTEAEVKKEEIAQTAPAESQTAAVAVVEDDEEATLMAQLKAAKAKKAAKEKLDAQMREAAETCVVKEPLPAVTKSITEIAVSKPQTTALALPADVSNGLIQGDFDESDVKPPRLQIVRGAGELAKKYSEGTILLDDAVLFKVVDRSEPQPTFRFIPIGLVKSFREVLDANDPDNKDRLHRISHSKDEVLRLGGTTEWRNGVAPTWKATATIMMLIERPEGSKHGGFNLEAKGKFYSPAVYYASGTCYREMATKIYAKSKYELFEVDAQGNSYSLMYKKFWLATLFKKPSGSFSVFTFDARLSDEITGEEVRQLCRRLLNGMGNKAIEVAE